MAELKDMKLSPAEQKEATTMVDKPDYPWGLQLNINDEQYEKLFSSLPEVGKTVMISARAKISGVSQSDREGGEQQTSCQLQIMEMAVEPDEAPKKDAAESMYGKG